MAGMKVVCVDAKNVKNPKMFSSALVEGSIYTVEDVKVAVDGKVGVVLEEIICLKNKAGDQQIFKHERFRPLDDIVDETDISVFTGLLKKIEEGDYDKSLEEDNPYLVEETVNVLNYPRP